MAHRSSTARRRSLVHSATPACSTTRFSRAVAHLLWSKTCVTALTVTATSWLACCMSAGGCGLFCLILHQQHRRSCCIHSNSVLSAQIYGAQAFESACKSADSTSDDPLFENMRSSAQRQIMCCHHPHSHIHTRTHVSCTKPL